METIKSNAGATKGKTLGWAFTSKQKAATAAKKHNVENPQKKG